MTPGVDALDEFRTVAARLSEGDNAYVGRGQIARLRKELLIAEKRVAEQQARLARHLLRVGEVQAAVAAAEDSGRIVARLRGTPGAHGLGGLWAMVRRTLATAYLRSSEVENCIARHNDACCIFPLENGGLHDDAGPASRALELYLEMATQAPDDLEVRWLCNVMAMAADRADELPESVRIPDTAFESEYDLGRFTNVASALGVDAFGLCGGSAVDDFDGNGRLDIAVSNFDPSAPLTLFLANGDGGFEDRTRQAGLLDQLGGLNLISADYDSDGDADLFVMRGAWLLVEGRIRNSLLRNAGNATFDDVTAHAGLASPSFPTQAATFGDFDSDGHVDLYVGNEALRDADGTHRGLPSQLFLNDGDGTFTVSRAASNERYCKGVTAGDYDNDGDLDLYVSNIGGELGINRLYRNEGDGSFADVAHDARVAEPRKSFATWFFDHDNDGWLDLFVAAYDATLADIAADHMGLEDTATRPRLYRNLGDGTFRDRAAQVGLDRPFLPMGAKFGDLDNDGWLDVYLATGNPPYETLMPNVALRNDEARRFQDVTRSTGLGHLQKGHGVTFADLDDDGDQDIYHELGGFFPGDGFANALFENPGHGNRFLQVELVGTTSNLSGLGARVRVTIEEPTGLRVLHRAVGSVSSFGGSPRRQEIGLGRASRIVCLEVEWPRTGVVQRFPDVPLDARVRVTEGTEELEVAESLTRGFREARGTAPRLQPGDS